MTMLVRDSESLQLKNVRVFTTESSITKKAFFNFISGIICIANMNLSARLHHKGKNILILEISASLINTKDLVAKQQLPCSMIRTNLCFGYEIILKCM
jgi:hypothetical protein